MFFVFHCEQKTLRKSCALILKTLKHPKFCYSYDYLVTELRVVQSARSVIILVNKRIRLPPRGRPILLITRMITDRIGLHSLLLPLQIEVFPVYLSQLPPLTLTSPSRSLPRCPSLHQSLQRRKMWGIGYRPMVIKYVVSVSCPLTLPLIMCASFVIGYITATSPKTWQLAFVSTHPFPPAGRIRGERPWSCLPLDATSLVPSKQWRWFWHIYMCGCRFLCA